MVELNFRLKDSEYYKDIFVSTSTSYGIFENCLLRYELIFDFRLVYLDFGHYNKTSYALIKGGGVCRNLKYMM